MKQEKTTEEKLKDERKVTISFDFIDLSDGDVIRVDGNFYSINIQNIGYDSYNRQGTTKRVILRKLGLKDFELKNNQESKEGK
jgi:hypothetical protein